MNEEEVMEGEDMPMNPEMEDEDMDDEDED